MIKTIDRLISHIAHTSRPERIILFGSVATGRQDVSSDIDLLVITHLGYRKDDLIKEITCFAQEFSLKADILILTPGEAEKASLNSYSFLSSIIDVGKIVYQKII